MRARGVKLFAGWGEKLLIPILVNLLSAAALFGLALLFKPLVYSLLSPPEIEQYPLVCFAEPYPGDAPDERRVDFYIINLTDRSYDRAELIGILSTFNPDPDRTLTPDIALVMTKSAAGQVVAAQPVEEFNRNKGNLVVKHEPNGRTVTIAIGKVEPRAFLKVTIVYSGMRNEGIEIDRTAKILVPFEFDELQDRCFQS